MDNALCLSKSPAVLATYRGCARMSLRQRHSIPCPLNLTTLHSLEISIDKQYGHGSFHASASSGVLQSEINGLSGDGDRLVRKSVSVATPMRDLEEKVPTPHHVVGFPSPILSNPVESTVGVPKSLILELHRPCLPAVGFDKRNVQLSGRCIKVGRPSSHRSPHVVLRVHA